MSSSAAASGPPPVPCASVAAAAPASAGGMTALIAQREQELAQLRTDSLRALEQQVNIQCICTVAAVCKGVMRCPANIMEAHNLARHL